MRLFVAVDVSDEVRRTLAALMADVSSRPAFRRAGVAWVPAERVHVTIQFIGHVSEGVAEEIRQRLVPAYPVAPFTLEAAGLGAFPAAGRLRVIWVGLRSGLDGLQRVHEETVRRLDGVPFRRDARPFLPHLTIGRLRQPGAARLRRDLGEAGRARAGRCTIEAVTLYESRLSPKGATYLPILRTPLLV